MYLSSSVLKLLYFVPRDFEALNMRAEDGLSMVTKLVTKQEEPESESFSGACTPPNENNKDAGTCNARP